MTTHILTLPGFTPTPLNRLMRGRRRDRIRLAKADHDLVCYYAREQGIAKAECPRRVSVEITVAPGQRRCDPDGVWKGLLDSLVAARLLVNDSARWVQLGDVTWGRGERRTVVTLEDLSRGSANKH